MFFSILTLVSALFISSVAIYYSVSGLVALFGGEPIAAIWMGVAIETGKLVSVLWLHHHWNTRSTVLKYGLSGAVAALMILTSVGIYGFLSKSHIEQAAANDENIAQIERIDSDIARQRAVIERARERLEAFETNTAGADSNLQAQIDREQTRIDKAYERVQPAIDAELKLVEAEDAKIKDRVSSYDKQIAAIDEAEGNLQRALAASDIRTAQSIVGAKVDGQLGKNTSAKIAAFRAQQQEKRVAAQQEIEKIKTAGSQAKDAALKEIDRIRARVETEILQSNELIARLKSKLGTSTREEIDGDIAEQQSKINAANLSLDSLLQNKAVLETNSRKLEAEVGPIKYVAELIYAEDVNRDLLEDAVRWLIILIIFVFDPLAVMLLVASQYSFEEHRSKKELREMIHEEVEKVEHEKEEAEEVKEEPAPPIEFEPLEENIVFIVDPEPPKPESVEKPVVHNPTVWPSEIQDLSEKLEIVDDWTDEPDPVPAPKDKPAAITLVKTAENYVDYNGKSFRIEALIDSHPELGLDFDREVEHGEGFPGIVSVGKFFLRTDSEPTKLYRFNGSHWDPIDKGLLQPSAYSRSYIEHLIVMIGDNKYNPELLNDIEKQHIENLLSEE